jgi:fluoroacetyl-CoA thioesterase
VRKTRRVAAHHAQSGAAIATGDELFDATIVEPAARRSAVFHEHFRELAALAHRVLERGLEEIVCNHLTYRTGMSIGPGSSASVSLVVEDHDTAIALGSGDVPVLATPRLIALAEQASIEAIAGALPAGKTSVGYEVQLAHLAPTPVGGKVTADATLEAVEGRRLTFRVSVNDARGLVAAGRVTRVVVDRDRFVERTKAES